MKEELKMLAEVESGDIGSSVAKLNCKNLPLFVELLDAGYVKAIRANTMAAELYLEPKLTHEGRHYLELLRSQNPTGAKRVIAYGKIIWGATHALMTLVALTLSIWLTIKKMDE